MSTRSEDECLICSHIRSEHFNEPVGPDQEPVPHCEACYVLGYDNGGKVDSHEFVEDKLEVDKRWAIALGDLDPDEPPAQVGGDHYSKRAIQPIEYIMANGLDFCEGNVIKLVTRWRDKGGIEDLEKIIQYAQFLKDDAKANPGKYRLES